jgi:hypothetical protein
MVQKFLCGAIFLWKMQSTFLLILLNLEFSRDYHDCDETTKPWKNFDVFTELIVIPLAAD